MEVRLCPEETEPGPRAAALAEEVWVPAAETTSRVAGWVRARARARVRGAGKAAAKVKAKAAAAARVGAGALAKEPAPGPTRPINQKPNHNFDLRR